MSECKLGKKKDLRKKQLVKNLFRYFFEVQDPKAAIGDPDNLTPEEEIEAVIINDKLKYILQMSEVIWFICLKVIAKLM